MTILEEQQKSSMKLIEGKLKDIAMEQEEGSFERGELKKELEKIADEFKLSFHTVKKVYYQDVKKNLENPKNEYMESNKVITVFNKCLREFLVDGEIYFVAKDVFDCLSINRSSNIVRDTIDDNDKLYIPIKNKYGILNTAIVKKTAVEKLCNILMTKLVETEGTNIAKSFLSIINDNSNEKLLEEKREIKVNVDEKIAEYSQKSSASLMMLELEDKKLPYRFGDVVDVVVTNVVSYGVLCETLDEFRVQGLIHISEVKNTFIQDLSLYFEVGDEIQAKVKIVSDDNKLQLSTKDFKLPLKNLSNPPINPFAEKLAILKEKMEENKISEKVIQLESKPIIKNMFEKESNVNNNQALDYLDGNKAFNDLVKIVNGKVGALTPRAKEELINQIEKHGIVQMVVGVLEASKDFENDLGLQFIKEVSKRMEDHL